jgi:ATP-binding cassette subfamily C protein
MAFDGGLCPQELFLFHDTILRNVTLGDSKFSSEEAEAVLRVTGAWEFVAALPDGIHSVVGERG